ncbi:hypothetical protein ACU4GD_42095 [Cupriavidus basilensis]
MWLLVHARKMEDEFMAAGYGVNSPRRDVQRDFIVVGLPATRPGWKGGKDVIAGFKKVPCGWQQVLSRAAIIPGTDLMEKDYWKQAGIEPKGSRRGCECGARDGGGVDHGGADAVDMPCRTWPLYGAYRAKTEPAIIALEGDPKMFSFHMGVIAVNPAKHPGTNYADAMKLVEWITSKEGQGYDCGL